jgi:glyoxylase-like metal-dependent hydrolase (beta-lactamase superfamily II)
MGINTGKPRGLPWALIDNLGVVLDYERGARLLPENMFLHKEETHIWPASANVLVIRDTDGAILVDVGCGKEEVYQRLKDFLSSHGLKITDVHTVLLTHAHPDHMGAMSYLLEEITPRIFLHPVEIPLAADPSLLNATFDIDLLYAYGMAAIPREEADILEYFRNLCPMCSAEATHSISCDEPLALGQYSFRVIATPGHARGLVSLYEERERLLFSADAVGDVVAWYSPSSGGLDGFLEGLDRLAELPASVLVPSHGGISTSPLRDVERTRERLLRRESRILRELDPGPVPFPDLVLRVFKDPLISFFPGPQILQCHLDKLEAEGRVERRGADEGWLVRRL